MLILSSQLWSYPTSTSKGRNKQGRAIASRSQHGSSGQTLARHTNRTYLVITSPPVTKRVYRDRSTSRSKIKTSTMALCPRLKWTTAGQIHRLTIDWRKSKRQPLLSKCAPHRQACNLGRYLASKDYSKNRQPFLDRRRSVATHSWTRICLFTRISKRCPSLSRQSQSSRDKTFWKAAKTSLWLPKSHRFK